MPRPGHWQLTLRHWSYSVQRKPLSGGMQAWRAYAAGSLWVLRSVEKDYSLQFARHLPEIAGVTISTLPSGRAEMLCQEMNTAGKGSGSSSPSRGENFPHSQKRRKSAAHIDLLRFESLWPILDLWESPCCMLTQKQLMENLQPYSSFITLDSNDTYFLIQINFQIGLTFKNTAYKFLVLPFVLSLAPRTFRFLGSQLDTILMAVTNAETTAVMIKQASCAQASDGEASNVACYAGRWSQQHCILSSVSFRWEWPSA